MQPAVGVASEINTGFGGCHVVGCRGWKRARPTVSLGRNCVDGEEILSERSLQNIGIEILLSMCPGEMISTDSRSFSVDRCRRRSWRSRSFGFVQQVAKTMEATRVRIFWHRNG